MEAINKIQENIKLTNKRYEEYFDDLVNWKKIEGYDYSVHNTGKVRNDKTGKLLRGCANSRGYLTVSVYKNKKSKAVNIHRLVAELFIDNPNSKEMVDHIDGDKTNNSINNLRWATNQENSRNTQLSIKNTSGVKGVTFENNKFRARLKLNGKTINFGSFDTLEEATEARQRKAKELFGDFINKCEL